jgi:hypothetical protein
MLDGHAGGQDERRHVVRTRGTRRTKPGCTSGSGCESSPLHRPRTNLSGRRIEHDRSAVAAGRNQAPLERNRHDRDDAVAAHRAEAFVVHEQHARMRIRALGLGQERAVHVEWPRGSNISARRR